ncbi:MAG: hypothetical protein AAB036_02430 [Elusimicrobiota bacterium]
MIGLPASRLSRVHPLVWLGFAGLVCYAGVSITRLGLYHDDWPTLEHMVFAPDGFWSALGALARGEPKLLLRPLSLPIFAGLYSLFGLSPLGWHLVSWAANVWIAWGLMRLARGYGIGEGAAMAGALLYLGYPNKDSTYFWCLVGLNAYSLVFLVEALVAHAQYVETGRASRLALSLGCLGVCLASYDQSLLMAPVWLLSPGWKDRRPPGRAWTGFYGAAVVSVLYCMYKFVAAPVFVVEPRPMSLSLARVPEVLMSGAAAQFGWDMWAGAIEAVVVALRYHPGLAAAGIVIPGLALRGRAVGRGVDRGVFGLAVGMMALSYAVFIPSHYRMDPISHFNRFNNIGAFATALAAAGAASAASRRGAAWALAGLAGACLVAHSGFAYYWIVSAEMQERVRRIIVANSGAWAAGRALLVRPPAYMVGGRAPVFLESWDVGGAVHIWTGQRDRRVYVTRPGVEAADGGVKILKDFIPYSGLALLDARTGTLKNADRDGLEALLR